MKLIRKTILILVIINAFIIVNAKSASKKALNSNEEAVDSELIFLEKLFTLDTNIKDESQKKQTQGKSGFEEFDDPVTKVNRKEDSIDSVSNDQESLRDAHEDKFAVGYNSDDNMLDAEKDNFEDKNNENIIEEEKINFLELGAKTAVNTNDADFFKNKLDEINKFEIFLLEQEKQLEQKSRELFEKTKSFLK